MMKIRLDIQEITTLTAQTSQEQLALNANFLATIVGVDKRVSRIEEMLREQSLQLQANQFAQVGLLYAHRKRSPSPKKEMAEPPARAVEGIGVRVTPYIASCRNGCLCACHSQRRSSAPALLNSLLGRLFATYTGVPILNPKCDDEACRGSRASKFGMEYWFPTSFWSTIVRMQVDYHPNAGPSLQLETLRTVPDSAQCVSYAVNGNITGLQHLFRLGMASPRDVSSGRGYSLLRWALYAKQYKTCEFLVHAGSDPDYLPIAASDNSPRIKACHFLLEGGLSDDALSAMRTITNGSQYLDDYIDDSRFTRIHRIVLGLSMQDLQEELLLRPEDINAQDAMGRTPLAWAAARGDSRSVATLLTYGADPNIIDVQISGPLSNAAAQGHTACVALLLEGGADPDPQLPKGVRKGSPLSVATRNCKDPMVLKKLLDFGANVNQVTVEGNTPLFHAARNDNASFAILLLEHGADINATSTASETPLTTAIRFNSHNVLRLLLERWHEYAACPRLKGPNLVEIAALYGDCETLSILAGADHFRTRHDQQYALRDFRAVLSRRGDVTERITAAFDELLTLFNAAADLDMSEEGLLESGFFSCVSSRANTFQDGYVRDTTSDGDSVESFEDALEKLEGQEQPEEDD